MPTDRPVALKFVNAAAAADNAFGLQFQRELRASARLTHPSVIRVLDHGLVPACLAEQTMGVMAEGAPWVAMELVEPIPAQLRWERICRFTLQLLDALAYAHARGTLHRDIKPANLGWRASDDRAILLDFGLAALADDRTFASTLGTPHYAAPEQILGDEWAQGPWTDLYALGATLWTWLSGSPMFASDERAVLLECHLSPERPEPPVLEGMPDAAREWLARLVRRDMHARPQHAAHAAAELRAVLRSRGNERWSWTSTPKLERSTTLRRDVSDVQLHGLGLQLVAMREPNLQGRAEVQGELVDALAAALAPDPQRQRTLALSCSAAGEAEHVATWLCRAADEQGVARVVHISDPPEPIAIVASALQTDRQGIALPAARAWLCRDLPGSVQRDLEFIAGMPGKKASLEAAARVLIAVARTTPIVTSGHAAVPREWIKSVCQRAPRDARLAAVLSGDTTDEARELAPLSLLALVRTLRDLVGLDGRSADVIAERAQGSTRELVRLVIELQQRGALVEGPRGLVARDEAVIGALSEVRESRLRGHAPEELTQAIDVVALTDGWAPDSAASMWVDEDRAETLAVWLERSDALAPSGAAGFTIEARDREAWIRTMPQAERALVARALLADPRSASLAVPVRAQLMLHAGEGARAWACVSAELEERLESAVAIGIFEPFSLAREIADAAPSERRAIELGLFEARMESLLQRARPAIERAEAMFPRIEALEAGPERTRLLIRALVAAATPRPLVDELDDAREMLVRANGLLDTSGWAERERPVFVVRTRLMLGFVHFRLGEYAQAVSIAEQAVVFTRAAGMEREYGNALYARAMFDELAPPEELVERLEAARRHLCPRLTPIQYSFTLSALVPHFLALGRVEEGLSTAREAFDLIVQLGSREVTLARWTRGIAFAHAGLWHDAAADFATVEAEYVERGRPYDNVDIAAWRMLCATKLGQHERAAEFERRLGSERDTVNAWVQSQLGWAAR